MDTGLLVGMVGVIISILLYFLADRKTIGTKREKINSIYEDIKKTIFRSIIREGYIPNIEEIDRIISTKCLENKLKIYSFPEPLEFIDAVYTKILQDEVLEGKKKTVLIKKINEYIEQNSKEITEEVEEEPDVGKEDEFRLILMIMSSVMAVVITFFVTINRIPLFSKDQLILLVGTFVIAIGSIKMLSSIKRFKEENTVAKQSQDRYKEYKILENNVSKLVKELDTKTEPIIATSKGIIRPDFEFRKGNKNYFIEIKSFTTSAPRSSIYQLMNSGKLIKQQGKNNITILVINNKRAIAPYTKELAPVWDYIFDEKEFRIFRNKLVHNT